MLASNQSLRRPSFSKRILDFSASVLGLALLGPFLAVIALLIWAVEGRPIFFRQLRPGFRGKPFSLVKFRTMSQVVDEEGFIAPDLQRLTRLGSLIRRLSLDELPQLWNILRGEMSLVGPRPLMMEYLELYTPEQARRHDVLPGITGWAQIQGRQELPFSRRLELDIWYVDHQSFWLDIKILYKTVFQIMGSTAVGPVKEVDVVDDLGLTSALRKKRPNDC